MMRDVVRIDEARCDGCGLCVTACAEGAIALVEGKALLVSEAHCDGLGACLGHCPQDAITVARAEAAPFDGAAAAQPAHGAGACPGSRAVSFAEPARRPGADAAGHPSALRHWPVQLHLVAPAAPYFRGADVLLAADCVAYAVGGFHRDHLAGRSLAIACPKLDVRQEVYLEKLVAMIDEAEIASLTVMVMEVPCCGGLVQLARLAAARASRRIPVDVVVAGIRGDIVSRSRADRPAGGLRLPTLTPAPAGRSSLEWEKSDRS
ncbi:MAG: 4Fe-4S ferredoxin [Acidobacteria bacterium]|nr:MAG: 4Fe-4S ferredoxin [Acidobacteriota bacterium]